MKDRKPAVLVIMGGPDAEREVSLCSGKEVAEALRKHRPPTRTKLKKPEGEA